MSEPTCPQLVTSRDAASLIFNLPGYDVIDAVDLPCGGRRVVVQARSTKTRVVLTAAWSRRAGMRGPGSGSRTFPSVAPGSRRSSM